MGADTIIGIDLGTSTTEAAVIRDGKPVMIVNFDGQVITPSAAGVDKRRTACIWGKGEGAISSCAGGYGDRGETEDWYKRKATYGE